jgi:xylulokinase
MALAMGIDLGTSSAKTVLVDEEGHVVATASAGYPLQTPHPDWVEQSPSDWWHAVCKTIRQAIQELTANPKRRSLSAHDIKGLSLSGQMNGAVLVDAAGYPLRPALLWLDHRSQRQCDEANQRAGDLLRKLALHVLNPVNTLAKVLWLRQNEPSHYANAYQVLLPKDWVGFKLTGVFASEVSDASATAALDLYKRNWSDAILETLEVRRQLFPRVVESPTIVGYITKQAAEETGLVSGTPLCAGGGDVACLAVGSGVIKPGVISVGIGTAGHALAFAESISDAAFNQLWPMCHAVPNKYFWLGCSFTGGASLTWLRSQLDESFEALIKQAERVPASSDGLFFLPWLEGTATPHPDALARGGWLGLTLRHTKAHLIRALMEGVVFDLRHSLECFKRLGLPIEELRIGEGGAKSALWRQIQADIFGQEVRVMEAQDASAIGAAIIAGFGVGMFDSFESACEKTILLGEAVKCNSEPSAIYDRAYRRYSRLYPSLKEWFHEEEP